MNLKAFIALALENLTPDQKVALMCKLAKKDPSAYAHLDNGRKSMTAGNVLRGLCKAKDFRLALAAERGLTDIDIDEDTPPVAPVARPAISIAKNRAEPQECRYPCTADGTMLLPLGCGAFMPLGIIGRVDDFKD